MSDAFEKARAVQARLNERYGSEPWFAGVGIGKGEARGTFAVEILVADTAKAVSLPADLEGIEVRAVSTGPIFTRQSAR
ncbi:MAG: hypothetical protein ACFBRM_10995 [Pikeienuella sp.]